MEGGPSNAVKAVMMVMVVIVKSGSNDASGGQGMGGHRGSVFGGGWGGAVEAEGGVIVREVRGE